MILYTLTLYSLILFYRGIRETHIPFNLFLNKRAVVFVPDDLLIQKFLI